MQRGPPRVVELQVARQRIAAALGHRRHDVRRQPRAAAAQRDLHKVHVAEIGGMPMETDLRTE